MYFDYDALGRRIRKRDASSETLFLWDGLQMVQEQRRTTSTTYLYEPGNHIPLARIDDAAPRDGQHNEAGLDVSGRQRHATAYFSTEAAGIPDELRHGSGELLWSAGSLTWGAASREHWFSDANAAGNADATPLQNLRFQGQYLDRETGLHYNTFRFFDPDIGRFISEDPIGLNGGENLQLYAVSPHTWIDPLGLSGTRFPEWMATRQGYQRQHLVPYSLRDHPIFVRSGMDIIR